MTEPGTVARKLDAAVIAALRNRWKNAQLVIDNCPRCQTTHQQLKDSDHE